MRLFCGVIHSKMLVQAVDCHMSAPFLSRLMKVHALVAARAGDVFVSIPIVRNTVRNAQVGYAVIVANAIDVVYFFRPFAVDVEPRQTVRIITTTVDRY